MTKAFIYGNGGHAHVIASFLSTEAVFLVPDTPASDNEIAQAAFEADITAHAGDIYIGIGDNAARTRIYQRLVSLGRRPAVCVAPTAFVAKDAVLEAGAVVCAGAVIGSRAHIGCNAIVNSLSSVDHDCILGDNSQITAGVTIGGNVTIGKDCFFGIKSGVIPKISIGDNVQIMAGSLVTKPVPDNTLVGGSPAKVMRSLV